MKLVSVSLVCAALATAVPAHADPSADKDACAASEASAQLAPTPEALAAAGLCLEAAGDLTGAEQRFAHAVELTRQNGGDPAPHIAQTARIRAANAVVILDLSQVSVSAYVALSIGDLPLHRPRGAVRMQAIVAPGVHTVRATRPGCESWQSDISVAPGEVTTVTIPGLECVAVGVRVPDYDVVDLTARKLETGPQPLTRNERIGLYLFGASTGAALYTMYAWSESTKQFNLAKAENCRRDDCGNPEGRALRESGHTQERRAWIAGGVAAGAFVTGFYLRTIRSKADMGRRVAAIPTGDGGVLVFGGAF